MEKIKYDVDFLKDDKRPYFNINYKFFVNSKTLKIIVQKTLIKLLKTNKNILDDFENNKEIELEQKYYNLIQTNFKKIIIKELDEARKYNILYKRYSITYCSVKKKNNEEFELKIIVSGEFYV